MPSNLILCLNIVGICIIHIKDFFLCLSENHKSWPDIYSMFKFSISPYTICGNCHQEATGSSIKQMVLILPPPTQRISLSDYISHHLHRPSFVPGWRHEDGCGQKTVGQHYQRINDVTSMNFFIILVERLMQKAGKLVINSQGVDCQNNIQVTDWEQNTADFKPIAVIHHTGN